MGDDKPFACASVGCGMQFTNEDHLTVHSKKHEMSLSLNTECNSAKSGTAAMFVDQTPTPTRFIRNCEEVGLFQELNPFEEQFRKHFEASKLGNILVADTNHGSSDNDILNTPSILPDDLQADTCDDLLNCRLNEQHPIAKEVVVIDDEGEDEASESLASESINIAHMSRTSKERKASSDGKARKISISKSRKLSVASSTSVESLVTTCTTNSISSLENSTVISEALLAPICFNGNSSDAQVEETSEDTISISAVTTTPFVALPTILPKPVDTTAGVQPSLVEAPMVQLILKLPDGRSVPLHIPAQPTMPTSEAPAAPPRASISPLLQLHNSGNSNGASYAKMKLRETLIQGSNGCDKLGFSFQLSKNKRAMAFQEIMNIDSASNDSDFNEKSNSTKRKNGGDEDPDEKRRRFLERNRAAATRCRQKRKKWIRTLESKADELAGMNEHLQNEVAMLRNEVAHLKSMLLAHKDCPVTQQQQKHMGNLNNSTIIVSTCSNGNIQISADEAIASSALTCLDDTGATTEETTHPPPPPPPPPLVLRTIMTHEQALALLTRSSQLTVGKQTSDANDKA